jgi:RNA polymerase sigma-70 factor (ECF subfamily)
MAVKDADDEADETERPLTRAFGAAPSGPDEAARLEAMLSRVLDEARAAWPEVTLPADVFARHLGAQLRPNRTAEEALTRLNTIDLYLACACARGDTRAIATFEKRFFGEADLAVARIDASSDFREEVRQTLRERLFVGERRIAQYRGQGPLAGWLRTAALRLALNLRQRTRVHRAAVDVLARDEGVPLDRELELVRAQYAGEVQEALAAAIVALPSEARHLLRLHYVHGIQLEKIGKLFKVAKSTISRRLGEARGELLDEAKRLLRTRLKVSDRSLTSLLDVMGRDLDLSLSGLLADDDS